MENEISKVMESLGKRKSDYERPVHLLMIGRPASGKTSLAGLFITGESGEGHAGPDSGTVCLESNKHN